MTEQTFKDVDLIRHLRKVRTVYAISDTTFEYNGKKLKTDMYYANQGIDVFLDTFFKEHDIKIPEDILKVRWIDYDNRFSGCRDSLKKLYMTLEKNRNEGNDESVTQAQLNIIATMKIFDEDQAKKIRGISQAKSIHRR